MDTDRSYCNLRNSCKGSWFNESIIVDLPCIDVNEVIGHIDGMFLIIVSSIIYEYEIVLFLVVVDKVVNTWIRLEKDGRQLFLFVLCELKYFEKCIDHRESLLNWKRIDCSCDR